MSMDPETKRLQELYPNIIFEEPVFPQEESRRRMTVPLELLTPRRPNFAVPLGPNEDYRKVLSRLYTAIWTFRAQPGNHVRVIKIIPLLNSLVKDEPPTELEMNARVSDEMRTRITSIRIQRYRDDPNAQLPGTIRPGRGPVRRPSIPGPGAAPTGGIPQRIQPNWRPQSRPVKPTPLPSPDLFDMGATKLLAPPTPARRPAPKPAQPAATVRTRRPSKT